MEQITSRKNPLITHVRKLLGQRSWRRECGEYVLDGEKLLEEAVSFGAEVTAVLHTADVVLPPLPERTRVVQVPEDVMQSVSLMRAPQGVLFTCRTADTAPPTRLRGERYLVLDGLQDPGNIGTIWRTADALGADGLLLTGACADPWNPKTARATMGACFRLPVYEVDYEALNDLLRRSELTLYATALRQNTQDVRDVALTRCAVAIGSEGRGVSQTLLDMSRGTLSIPMRKRCESLNAAVAAAVVLWEMARGQV